MKKINKTIILILLIIIFTVIFFILTMLNYIDIKRKKATSQLIDDAITISNNSAFAVNEISLYSSAYATSLENNNSSWKLNLYQYTDIAIYVSNISQAKSISSIYIDNFSCKLLEIGAPSLYFKNLYNFGKFENFSNSEKIEFEIIPTDQELDFTKPQIYSDLSNPITLEYTNLIASNLEINNVSSLTYNGKLLKSTGITLSSIEATISFKLHLVTDDLEEHSQLISFEIPLSNSSNSIYDESISSILSNSRYLYQF